MPNRDDEDDEDDEEYWMSIRYVFPLADGTYFIAVPPGLRDELLRQLDALRDMILAGDDDPHLVRLFPGAYTDDPEREAEYQRLTRGELLESRLAAFETLETTLKEEVVTEADLHQWLMAINAVRLVLAMIIGVDHDEFDLDPDDERYPTYVVYMLFGNLMHHVYSALRDGGALDRT